MMLKSLILLVLSFVGLYIIRLGTAEPGDGAGNGNPMLIIIFLFSPIFISAIVLFVNRVKKFIIEKSLTYRLILLTISTVSMLVLAFLQIQFIENRISYLGGGPDVPESWIYRYGWFNQFTNTFYFNYYVFLFILFLATNLTILVQAMRQVKGDKNES